MDLSIVIPVFNEEGNVELLYQELKGVFATLSQGYEVIWVDDGSRDQSLSKLQEITQSDSHHKVIRFTRNFGQTAAMAAGINLATGNIIIPMDADRQNDPADIPRFLAKMAEGFDVVSGWRSKRQDKLLSRKIPSWVANWVIRRITGVNIHDYGCSMKAYRRDYIQGLNLYGEMHRLIPAYIAWQGGTVSEIAVNHRPRVSGHTKYGLSRTFKIILDLIVLKFLSKYLNRPIHFFGGVGFVSLFVGILSGLAAIILKIIGLRHFVDTPLPIASALFVIVGIQFILMGILSEMVMRTYYESQGKQPYTIKEKINF